MSPNRFHVGIDLGTTNTVVAYAEGPASGVHVFPLEQLEGARERKTGELLPSALYAYEPGELEGVTRAPFAEGWEVGGYAKRRGLETFGRSVTSAKSWLGHAGVDRTAPILPWGVHDAARSISPVDASAAILWHVRSAWNRAHPESSLEDQDVVLTLPASFDEDARVLTLSAAEKAGLRVRLLEEPMAAFYDLLAGPGRATLEALVLERGAATVLVVDVGGGTTDLSLLRAERGDSDLDVTRVAVGRHLLVGGDNLDLALAHALEKRLAPAPPDGRLDPARFSQLVLAAKGAKERLLGDVDGRLAEIPIAIAGAGSKLVGGTMRAMLTKGDVSELALDGFFPRVTKEARPERGRSALAFFGLPYERDPAISKHIAEFLAKHEGELPRVDALFLNGGVFHAPAIRARLVEIVSGFTSERLVVLPSPEPSLAVARGAALHALARQGEGIRIGGGSARALYVVAEGEASGRSAICVIPRGAEEAVRYSAKGREFGLSVGRVAKFPIFASEAGNDQPGDAVLLPDDALRPLPPLVTTVPEVDAGDGKRPRGRVARVTVEGELTEFGTLELACVERGAPDPRRYRLSFALRDQDEGAPPLRSASPKSQPPIAPPQALAREAALSAIERVYGKKKEASPREVKDLPRELERLLGEKKTWPIGIVRALADRLIEERGGRRRSEEHERNFWYLTGFCMRPGFGFAGDAERIAALAPLFQDRLAFPASARGWQAFFIGWRRVAPGLDDRKQTEIRDTLDPFVLPNLKKPKWKPEAISELRDLVTSLERPTRERRATLGEWVLERTFVEKDARPWLELARIGARVPAYASVDHVVPPAIIEPWIERLLRQKWESLPFAIPIALALGRATGDRARDISVASRTALERRFRAVGATAEELRALAEPVAEPASRAAERGAIFGDDIPTGLRLLA